MTWRNWAAMMLGLFIGNLIAEWIKHHFHLFGY